MKCALKDCDLWWHYTCGTRRGCITQFCGSFDSYCSRHVPDLNDGQRHGLENCAVCLSPMGSYNPADSIISSCCLLLDDWSLCFVHKKCVQKYVNHAGYDSMCINCPMLGKLTKKEWQREMRLKGIFIPYSDASWEKDGSFKDQVKNKCQYLKCPKVSKTRDVYTCFVCGCFPRHLDCVKARRHEDYLCPKCYDQSFVQRVPR